MGNVMRERLYWEEEDRRKCRTCGWEEETYEHVWERCIREREGELESWQREIERMLGEKGEGEEWMKIMESMRRTGEREGEESGEE